MAKVSVVIFDLDGTLIDVSARHYFVYRKVTNEFNGQALTKREYWRLKRDKTDWPELLKKSKISVDKLGDFLSKFIDLIEQPEQLKMDSLFPEAKKTLEGLYGYDLYLISLRRQNEMLNWQLSRLGLRKYFREVISGHSDFEGSHLKAGIIKALLKENKGLVIGDTEADINAAKEASCLSVAVLSGIRSKKVLESLQPDFLVENVGELPKIIHRL
jgi:phosphoglycolate phosphatase-like HAD superfamily hydrolase